MTPLTFVGDTCRAAARLRYYPTPWGGVAPLPLAEVDDFSPSVWRSVAECLTALSCLPILLGLRRDPTDHFPPGQGRAVASY